MAEDVKETANDELQAMYRYRCDTEHIFLSPCFSLSSSFCGKYVVEFYIAGKVTWASVEIMDICLYVIYVLVDNYNFYTIHYSYLRYCMLVTLSVTSGKPHPLLFNMGCSLLFVHLLTGILITVIGNIFITLFLITTFLNI